MKSYQKSISVYSKQRKNFGRQTLFQNVPAHMLDNIKPDKAEQKLYCLRNPVHEQVQATMPQSEHEANTKLLVTHEQGVNHTEGGWPRDVHLNNEEHVERHRRRELHDEHYVHTVMKLMPAVTHYIDQNNAIDMYQSYFIEVPRQAPVEKYNVRVANVFRDTLVRPVSCVAWTNEKKSKLAVAYCHKDYAPTASINSSNAFAVWDVRRQNEPISVMQPQEPCWQLACSPVEPDVIITGLGNGTVSLFDMRTGHYSIANSSPYNSHRDPVSALLYTQSRTHTEFFTGSSDGQCLWWDTRNLSKPLDQLPMSVRLPPNATPDMSNAEGVTSLQFDRGLPTKFLCGTESGLVINANRMGRNHSEILSSYWNAHCGPVRAVHRSPCTSRMFLTCGDWSVRVWSEEVRTAPIIVTKPYRHEVSDAAWAPRRVSSYMAVCGDGMFYYSDFLRRYNEAIATLRVSPHKLTKIRPHEEGKFVAVGDTNGALFLLQLSENMIYPCNQDKHLMHQTYQRETRREHIIDNRIKEIRLKLRAEEEAANIPEPEEPDEEALEKAAEDEYWKIVNEELREMGGTGSLTPHRLEL